MTVQRRILLTPNHLTLSRLILSVGVFIPLGLYSPSSPSAKYLLDLAVILFLIAGGTDLVDGYLARKYKMESSLGRILDPFVDKVLICGTFIYLAGANFSSPDPVESLTGITPWMVVLIIAREFLITALRGFSESRGVAFAATVFGKVKMFLQSATIVAILITLAHFHHAHWARLLRLAFIWPMVIFTLLSMLSYLSRAAGVMVDEKPQEASADDVAS